MTIDEVHQIREYIQLCESMESSRFLRETKNVRFNFVYRENEPIRTKSEGFDEDLLKSFLMDFRKTYLIGEKTSFDRMCNLLDRCTNDEKIKNNIARCRELYSQVLEKSSIGINLNNNFIKPKQIIDDWFNGHYFHGDANKKATLNSLHFVNLLHKTIFITTIAELTKLTLIVSNNAKKVLSDLK